MSRIWLIVTALVVGAVLAVGASVTTTALVGNSASPRTRLRTTTATTSPDEAGAMAKPPSAAKSGRGPRRGFPCYGYVSSFHVTSTLLASTMCQSWIEMSHN